MKCALILGITGLILGLLLGAADRILGSKDSEDENVVDIMSKLPGFNCGACGYAGCKELAKAVAKGDDNISKCKVIKHSTEKKYPIKT